MAEANRIPIGSRTKDLTGLTVGRWTVIEFLGVPRKDAMWLCRCECGTERSIRAYCLIRGLTHGCGCVSVQLQDLTGQVFGRLTVVEYAGRQRSVNLWKCRCECGNERVVPGQHLRTGNTRSCGCLQRELSAQRATNRNMRHGLYRDSDPRAPEFRIWNAMLARCYKPSQICYENYGGRGITVCERWRESFEDFYADMGPKPTPKHSIDRIDNDGNYEPGNCRWATTLEQQRNSRHNRLITFNGETMCLTAWAQRIGICRGTLDHRARKGWSVERMLTTPVRGH